MNDMVFEQYKLDGININPIINQGSRIIVFDVPFETNLNNLKSIFVVPSGVEVKIGDVVQESNVTINNFSAPITYTLKILGADSVNWIVIVRKESKVSIIGTPKLLQTLNAEVTGGDEGDTIKYQWKRNAVNIDGAVNKDYVVTNADIAQIISVEVKIINDALTKNMTLTSKSVAIASVNSITGIKVSFKGVGNGRSAKAVLYEMLDTANSKPISEINSIKSGDMFTFDNIPNGVYKIVLSTKGHAAVTLKGVIVNNSSTSLSHNIDLRTGDLNDDRIIDLMDLSKLLKTYIKKDDLTDLNGDGVVDLVDLSMVLKNYKFISTDINVAP